MPTTSGASQCSSIRSVMDRPSKTICSKLLADFQNRLRQSPIHYPCDLHTMMPTGSASKPVCCGRPYWMLARLPSACIYWVGCLSWRQSSTSSSDGLQPADFIRRTHAYTTSHKIPSRGADTGHKTEHMHRQMRSRQTSPVTCSLQQLGGYNI